MTSKFFSANAQLQSQLEQVVEETQNYFPQLAPNQIAMTWIAYEPPYRINTGGALSAQEFWQYRPIGASYRGVEPIDPAGMVNLFYLAAAHVWLEQGMIQTSPETERAMANLISASSSDAISYILDILSGTTSGPSLPAGPFETWASQRNIINRYFAQLNWPELRSININQKIWHDGPYGRERDFLGEALENRNQLSTEATARLLHSIVGGVSVSGARSQKMMSLLARKQDDRSAYQPSAYQPSAGQIHSLIGAGTDSTTKIWSHATAQNCICHEAAYIESASTHPYLLVVFVQGQTLAASEVILPFVSERIFAAAQQQFQSREPNDAY